MEFEDSQLVAGISARCSLEGHQDAIGQVEWSQDGSRLASVSVDGSVLVWDIELNEPVCALRGWGGKYVRIGWSKDGVLGAFSSKMVGLWDSVTGNEIQPRRIELDIRPGCWSPTSNHLATISGINLGVHEVDVDWQSGLSLKTIWSRRCSRETCISWSPDAGLLAAGSLDGSIEVIHASTGERVAQFFGPEEQLDAIAWNPDASLLASGGRDGKIRIWNLNRESQLVLEGHTHFITSLSFSIDGRFLVSKSIDDSVQIWSLLEEKSILTIPERSDGYAYDGLAINPVYPLIASLGKREQSIRVWDLDYDALLRASQYKSVVKYTSAKVVLVGNSNVGKSCLAMRLAEDRYPDDHEHGTTHGMRFWQMEAEELHPAAKPPDEQRRDVVLWDFGGQDEYQLVHQMFLHDTTLAMVLIDPTRGRVAMDEARDWSKRLEKHLGKGRAVKLLVGAKVDRKRELIDQNSIDALCNECGFTAFLDLSAKTGRNTKRLRKLISDILDWDQMARTSRPELFQHIRDSVEARRKKSEIVLTLAALKRAIKRSAPKLYQGSAVDAVSDQLATQGIIVRTRLTGGDEALVLQLPVIERYAGSLIIAARNNPRGVPMLEERLLGSTKTIPLPGMTKQERLSPAKERMVLECVVELMIRHGICFRHGGLLVFPTLFPACDADFEPLPHSVSMYYDFTGAIDNIYASLVSKLMVSEHFGDGRLKAGSVEFDRPGEEICGIRQTKRSSGFAHVDLYFAEETAQTRRDLFITFVEQHLQSNGVEIREHQAIKCSCGKVIDEEDVQANLEAGEEDVICPRCRAKTLISEGVSRIRQRAPESDEKLLALRKVIDEKTNQDAARLKRKIATGTPQARGDDPIRILHLSDLHFTGSTVPKNHLTPLLADLKRGAELGFESVDYIVISGDMTDRGGDSGFDKAREFTLELIEELGTDVQKCICVPGNHDVQDLETAYRWFGTEEKARAYNRNEARWHREGKVVFVEDRDLYAQRLKRFNDTFFSKVVKGDDYPLNAEEQALSYLFPETGIQFLTFNSAWQIDQFHRHRSGIHDSAINHAAAAAQHQINKAINDGRLKKDKPLFRLAVWHHALEGKWAMQHDTFLEHLQAAGVKLCLHGDVHESRRKIVNWWDRGGVHIVGAGTFGSPEQGRPESTPRLYNVIEIQPDLKSVRVHTRQQRKEAGAWKGWYEWPDPKGGDGQVPYFDVNLQD